MISSSSIVTTYPDDVLCHLKSCQLLDRVDKYEQLEGQHPLTGQRAANFRLLANQRAERRLVTQ